MKNFNIDLNEYSSKKPRIIRLLFFGAIVCLSFILLSLSFFLTFKGPLEWFFLVLAVYLALYIYFAWVSYKTKLYVKADENGIMFKFGVLAYSNDFIIWDSITRVIIGPTYISFFKKSGKRRRIQLGWLHYSKVIAVKDNIVEVCKGRRISYEIVDFYKYSDKKDKKGK